MNDVSTFQYINEWRKIPADAVLLSPYRAIENGAVFIGPNQPISVADARRFGMLPDITQAVVNGEPVPIARAIELGVITEEDLKP